MDKTRRGEIALILAKQYIREKGITFDFQKKFGKKAKLLGISRNEAREFVSLLVCELVNEVFTPHSNKPQKGRNNKNK